MVKISGINFVNEDMADTWRKAVLWLRDQPAPAIGRLVEQFTQGPSAFEALTLFEKNALFKLAMLTLGEALIAIEETREDDQPTVEAKIIVSINGEGDWMASRWHSPESVLSRFGYKNYYVTATIPIPTPEEVKTIQGEVIEPNS